MSSFILDFFLLQQLYLTKFNNTLLIHFVLHSNATLCDRWYMYYSRFSATLLQYISQQSTRPKTSLYAVTIEPRGCRIHSSTSECMVVSRAKKEYEPFKIYEKSSISSINYRPNIRVTLTRDANASVERRDPQLVESGFRRARFMGTLIR